MAAIAEAAGLPKANLHYYFGSKQELYRTALARILEDWLVPTHGITPEADVCWVQPHKHKSIPR